MNTLTEEQLILRLIKDDLINTRLINGLNELGLNAENYFSHLSSTIFKLMGFEDNAATEVVYERYLELTKAVKYISINESQKALDEMAFSIYQELCRCCRGGLTET